MEQSAPTVHVTSTKQMEEPSNMGGWFNTDVFVRLNKLTALGFKAVLVRLWRVTVAQWLSAVLSFH